MANALALDHEDDHLSDVGSMIRDPLEVFRNRGYLHGSVNGLRIRDHETYSFTKYLTIEVIHFLVVFAYFQSQIRVFTHESVQAFANHALGNRGHPGDIDIRLKLGFLIQFQGAFAEIDGHVSDPFQVRRDLESGCDEPQVAAGGLMQGE